MWIYECVQTNKIVHFKGTPAIKWVDIVRRHLVVLPEIRVFTCTTQLLNFRHHFQLKMSWISSVLLLRRGVESSTHSYILCETVCERSSAPVWAAAPTWMNDCEKTSESSWRWRWRWRSIMIYALWKKKLSGYKISGESTEMISPIGCPATSRSAWLTAD